MSINTSGFPNLNIQDKEKDENWHKRYVLAIRDHVLGSDYSLQYTSMYQSYKYFDGDQSSEEFSFLQETENGETLPAFWINYNKIRTKVRNQIGKVQSEGYDISVRAQNKAAVSERLEKKNEELGRLMIKEDLEELSLNAGMPLETSRFNSRDEIQDFYDKKYKDKSEIVITAALKYLAKKYKWSYERSAVFRDILIAGRGFIKCKVVNGLPKYERRDPRRMIFDPLCNDDYLSDSSYFGEVDYMPLAEAIDTFNLSEEDVKKIKQPLGVGNIGALYNSNSISGGILGAESSLSYLSGSEEDTRVLVFYAEWQDTKKIKRAVKIDKWGNTHYKPVDKKYKGKVVEKEVKIWRRATVIGGEIVREWGELENQIRSIDHIEDTKPSYIAYIPDYVNYKSVSIVEQLKGLQDLQNICMYQIQRAMSMAGGKGFEYDLAMLPDEWEVEDVLKYIKISGISFINSMKDGIPINKSSMTQFDMTLSDSIGQYLNISKMLDQEMGMISGINEAQEGVSQGAAQAVGTTRALMAQSSLTLAPIFNGFEAFSEDVFTRLCGLVKICWRDKKAFSPIIGDAGIDFLKEDIDISINDYAAFVTVTPASIQDEAKLLELVHSFAATGQIDPIDALELMFEKDKPTAVARLKQALETKEKERREAETQQQQMLQQQQHQNQMQMRQMELENDAREEQLKGERQRANQEQVFINNAKLNKQKAMLERGNKQVDNMYNKQIAI